MLSGFSVWVSPWWRYFFACAERGQASSYPWFFNSTLPERVIQATLVMAALQCMP